MGATDAAALFDALSDDDFLYPASSSSSTSDSDDGKERGGGAVLRPGLLLRMQSHHALIVFYKELRTRAERDAITTRGTCRDLGALCSYLGVPLMNLEPFAS